MALCYIVFICNPPLLLALSRLREQALKGINLPLLVGNTLDLAIINVQVFS